MMKRLAVLGALLLGIGVAANGCVVHPRVGADVHFSGGGGHRHYAPRRHVCYHGCGHGGYVVVERHHGHGGYYHHGGRRGGPRGRHW